MTLKLDRQKLTGDLAELRRQLKGMMLLSDAGREERIRRARDDFGFFCREYFPHHVKDCPSKFHQWIFGSAPNWRPGQRLVIAAPRGNAKTTILARLYPLWRMIRGDVRFVVVVQDTADGANQSVEVVKVELEENPRLGQDFPELAGQGRTWKVGEIVTRNSIKVRAFGSGMRIRGANFMSQRPDLIILDDLENDENVRTRDQRDKLERWFANAVLKLGPPDGSAQFICIGTILHFDSLLTRVAKRTDFVYHKFRALIRYPAHMDLWEEWERLLAIDPEAARVYYEARCESMDAGAEVLWPGVQPLYALMSERAVNRDAFSCEMQNEPMDSASQIFPPQIFTFYTGLPRMVATFGATDLALGKTRGDFAANIVLGRDAERHIYVLEADIARYTPTQIIARIIEWQRQYQCCRWGIEEVAFQEFFLTSVVDASRKAGVPLPAVGIRQSVAKEVRIESLAPYVKQGLIRFHPGHRLLLEQLQEYPKSSHDDGPDALHMAFNLAFSSSPIEFKTPGGSGGLRDRVRGWLTSKGF